MIKLFALLTATLNLSSLLAANASVTVDENGVIQPQAARDAIATASSAAVKIDFAEAKAEILTNVANTASAAMDEADRILTERTDFAVVRLFAAGVKDAVGAANTDESAEIRIVDNVRIDRTSDADNNLVTLTWQYVAGAFTSPRIIASAELSTNAFEVVEMTEPVQIEWGETFAFVATAKCPKAKYGSRAFFKVVGTPDAPVDDGQVFDIYSDGTDYTVDLIPARRYRMRIVSGRICGLTLVE